MNGGSPPARGETQQLDPNGYRSPTAEPCRSHPQRCKPRWHAPRFPLDYAAEGDPRHFQPLTRRDKGASQKGTSWTDAGGAGNTKTCSRGLSLALPLQPPRACPAARDTDLRKVRPSHSRPLARERTQISFGAGPGSPRRCCCRLSEPSVVISPFRLRSTAQRRGRSHVAVSMVSHTNRSRARS